MKSNFLQQAVFVLAMLGHTALSAQYVVEGCETETGILTVGQETFTVAATGRFINSGSVYFTGVTTLTNNGGMSERTESPCVADYRNPCGNTPGASGANVFDNSVPFTFINGDQPLRMYAATIDRNIQLDNEWQIVHAFTFNSGTVNTDRWDLTHFLHFRAGSTVSGNGAGSHVNGYAGWSGGGAFTLPVGDGGRQLPVGLTGDCSTLFTAAYFPGDPGLAFLPAGAPFNTNNKPAGIAVSQKEYWDINGATATPITLHFDADSDLDLIAGSLSQIVILGWNGTAWVSLGQTGSTGTLTDGGTVTCAAVVPDDYLAYALGGYGEQFFPVLLSLRDPVTGLNFPTPSCGDEVEIGVYVDDHFDNLYSFQFSLNWDPAELEFVDTVSTTIIDGNSPVVNIFPVLTDNGQFAYSFANLSSPSSLPDGTVLLVLRFRVLESNGNVDVEITGNPNEFEAISDPTFSNNGITPVNAWSIPPVSGPVAEILTYNHLLCKGDASGSATVTVTGGAGSSTYLWNDPASQTTETATGLSAGTYNVTITTAGGCTATADVTLTEPDDYLAGVVNPTATTCADLSDGTLTFLATGGVAPYDYAWDGPGTNDGVALDQGSSYGVNSLPAGSYAVTVTDANGCSYTETVTISSGPALAIEEINDAFICPGASVADVPLRSEPATATILYDWSGGATAGLTDDTSTGLNPAIPGFTASSAAGAYTVTVTATLGACQDTEEFTITINDGVTAGISSDDADNTICAGASAQLTATAGASYDWSTGATSQSVTATTAGDYTVTVTAANGCTGTATATLTMNSSPTASIGGDLSLCPGEITTLTAAGGTGYLWNTGAQTAAIGVGIAGAYSVTVTDANGCTDAASAQVQAFQGATAMIGGATSFCTGGSTELTASGGTGYAWSTGAQTATITASNPGSYTVTVTDANSCTGTATATVAQNNAPSVQITGDLQICSNETTTLTATAGASYAWSTGGSGQSVTVSTAGNYTVTVTAANGCTGTAMAALAVQTAPNAVISGNPVACVGQSVTLTASGGDQILWSTGSNAAELVLSQGGPYAVTVTNANGCSDVENVTVTISQTTFQITSQSTPETCAGTLDGSVALSITGGIEPFSYAWSNQMTMGDITGLGAGVYEVTVTDAGNCVQTATAEVCRQCKSFSGALRHWSGSSNYISGATVALGLDGSGSVTTGADGQFVLTANSGVNFSIQPTKTALRTLGVTAADFTRIQRHITLAQPFQTGYEVLAADANQDRRITTLDLILGNQCLLGNPAACNLWNAPVWRFVDADHVFPSVNAPWNPPVGITLNNPQALCGPVEGLDFIGLKSLDVVQPVFGLRPAPVVLYGADVPLVAGAEIALPIRVEGYADLASFQFALAFDPAALQWTAAEPAGSELDDRLQWGLWNAGGGEIRILQYGAEDQSLEAGSAIFILRFTALESGRWLSEVLGLDEAVLPAEAYTDDLTARPFQLRFDRSSGQSGPAEAENSGWLRALPNPAAGSTRLQFYLPAACEARLSLLDASGRVVYEQTDTYPAGAQERRVELPTPGVYVAMLQTAGGVWTVKIVGK